MRFQRKAAYRGPFDENDVPLLDYQGTIGRQHNPIAIAQYGLACFNRWCDTQGGEDVRAWLAAANWLERQLTPNQFGVPVWMHRFDWPYRETLVSPWYSGLAQGSGLSLLVRAAEASGAFRYANAAHRAFESFLLDTSGGGVIAQDAQGALWIEEYIVSPPSHILNGFIWALWGVYDYARWSGSAEAHELFTACVNTLEEALPRYDTGRWSLYEIPPSLPASQPSRFAPGRTGPRMLASRYYHELHIVQLRVLERLTGNKTFGAYATRWQEYLDNPMNRARALIEKAAFKLLHY